MNTIWRYDVNLGINRIDMPVGAKVLSLQAKANQGTMRALVNAQAPRETRMFLVIPTGGFVPEGATFLGTYQMIADDGFIFVAHVFEFVQPMSS